MRTTRAGFSLVEVIISLLILTVGVLAMAASTGYILSLVRQSTFRTERTVAVREVGERLRATDWANIDGTCAGNTFTVGEYTVTCETNQPSMHLKEVRLISQGPGYAPGGSVQQIIDTTAIVLAEPLP